MEKLGNFNILPKSPPSAYRDPAQGCLHINAGELDLHTSRSESLLPFLRDKCDSCMYYHSHKCSPFVRVQIRGRAFQSRLQPWGKPEGTLATHFFHMNFTHTLFRLWLSPITLSLLSRMPGHCLYKVLTLGGGDGERVLSSSFQVKFLFPVA